MCQRNDKQESFFISSDNTKVQGLKKSKKKSKFICSHGHEFEECQDKVYLRKKKCKECNSLHFLRPDIYREIHPSENGEVKDLPVGSRTKLWWRCKEGHDYIATVKDRTRLVGSTGCPKCAGKTPSKENNFSLIEDDIKVKWDYERNHPLTPADFTMNSKKKVHWVCKKDPRHRWRNSIGVISRGIGCPYCNGKKVCPDNSLLAKSPRLAEEWHAENKLTPDQVTAASSRSVKWACKSCSYTWTAKIYSRFLYERGCPRCAKRKSSSRGEDKIDKFLKGAGLAYEREKTFQGCKMKRRLRFDFYISGLNACIEYDGRQHFEEVSVFRGGLNAVKKSDKIKNDFCKDNKVMLLRIPYWAKGEIDFILEDFIGSMINS